MCLAKVTAVGAPATPTSAAPPARAVARVAVDVGPQAAAVVVVDTAHRVSQEKTILEAGAISMGQQPWNSSMPEVGAAEGTPTMVKAREAVAEVSFVFTPSIFFFMVVFRRTVRAPEPFRPEPLAEVVAAGRSFCASSVALLEVLCEQLAEPGG